MIKLTRNLLGSVVFSDYLGSDLIGIDSKGRKQMLELLASLDPTTLSGALATGIAALSACVVHLYKAQGSLQNEVTVRVQAQLDECLQDRKMLQLEQRQLWTALIKLDPSAEELRNIK